MLLYSPISFGICLLAERVEQRGVQRCNLERVASWCSVFFFFNDTATTEIYTLSLHDALPIFPELLDGRVKTLHPKIHAGLLARRDDPAHVAALQGAGIGTIDLLVVNLYPFQAT